MRRVLLVLSVLFAACHLEQRQATGPDFDIRQVVVVPDTVSIDPLGVVNFQAYGRTAGGDSVGVLVQWSATVGSISSDAVYIADTTDEDATVLAQLGGGADAVPLVGAATVHKRRLVALLLSPTTVTLPPGAVQEFTTRAVRADGDTVKISPQYSATGGTITSAGFYTAGAAVGRYRVIASRPSGVFDTASVTITQVPVAAVSVDPATANVPVGGVTQLTATTRDAAGTTLTGRAVTWSSDAPSVAAVSATGLVSGVAAGSATITATSEGQSGSAAMTVVMVPVASVTVSPATANLRVGTSALFIATIKDGSGRLLSGRAITWSSTAPSVATVSADGLVSAIVSGSATITATSEGQSGSSNVTVSSVPVASVTVSPASANLRVGGSAQLSAVTKDSAGNVLNARAVAWSSSASNVATVSASGLVSAVAPGSASIVATSEGQSGSASIAVTVVPVASVNVTPASAAVRVGNTVQLAVTTKDSANNVLTGRTVTWSSAVPTVATVSAGGLVSAIAAGSATITASSEGTSGTSAITVTVVPVASVAVSPATAALRVGSKVQLSATPKDSAGNTLTGRTITWSSNAPAVATVSASGLVSAVAAGLATVTAASEGKTGSAAITVSASSIGHAGWYVSPSGSSGGDGSAARPWNLQTGLNGGNGTVQPGDTIWLRGGTYAGTYSSNLNGTAAASIVVRQYPGERATLDGGTSSTEVLTVNGSYTIYWGFEIMESNPQRNDPNAGTGSPLRGDGVYVNNAHDIKLINLIVHDTGHGTYTEDAAHNIEIYGWIIYNGGTESTARSDGHGIYIKGDGIGWKIARDNVIFDQFGFGIHGYAQSGTTLKQLVFDGNVLFNNGTPSDYENPNMQLGGSTIADNDTVTNNMVYYSPGVTSSNGNVRIGYSTTANGTAVFRNNYIVGGTQALDVGYWSSLTAQSNTVVAPSIVLTQHDASSSSKQRWSGDLYYRDPTARAWQLGGTSYTFANWETAAGATDQASASLPSAPQVFVRPNRYESGRATVVIYNWPLQSAVAVDLSGIVRVGNRYEVRNVQNIFGAPVASGTYGGGTISIPMGGVAPPQPIGGSFQPLHQTGPNFDVFVVTSAP